MRGPLRQAQRQAPAWVGVGADLGDDQDAVFRAQGFADHRVGEAEAVELGGIHVIHAQLDRAAQQRDGLVAVAAQALELERAVADAGHGAASEPKPRGADGRSPCSVIPAYQEKAAWLNAGALARTLRPMLTDSKICQSDNVITLTR